MELNMRNFVVIAAATLLCGSAAFAEDVDDGELNPQSLTIDYWVKKLDEKPFNSMICVYGYAAAKMGWHEAARKIFEKCSAEGVEGAMPWMSWTEENGYDKPADPAKAADWDRRLAERGNSLGALNYGLDLLRGHGVAEDPIQGRAYIDRAAKAGDESARDLAAHGYDWQSATPSADVERYKKFSY
jgi:TPR repeat protein